MNERSIAGYIGDRRERVPRRVHYLHWNVTDCETKVKSQLIWEIVGLLVIFLVLTVYCLLCLSLFV